VCSVGVNDTSSGRGEAREYLYRCKSGDWEVKSGREKHSQKADATMPGASHPSKLVPCMKLQCPRRMHPPQWEIARPSVALVEALEPSAG